MPTVVVVVLVLLAIIAVGTAIAYHVIFRRPLPRTNGLLEVRGLGQPVEILRDDRGVPTITAADLTDACFAIGFAHGQDRLWQMEVQRRLAAGRLSEVFGERAVAVDMLMRRLGLRRVSEAEWHITHAAGAVRREVTAYAAGVNAAIRDRPLPAEFTILRHRPEPWEPEDSLAVGRLLGFSQAVNWEAQLVRMRLLKELGPELTEALDPVLGGTAPMAAADRSAAGAASEEWLKELREAEDLLALSAWTAASNSWVLHGSRTTTGRPLLANDPHGPIGIPSPWYRVDVRHGDHRLTGLTFCGAPYLLFGQNERLAWGVVNANVSIQDVYVERFNPNNPLQFDDCGEWRDAVRFREVIRVRGAEPRTEDVLVTRRGPVVSPAIGGTQPPMSLRWVGFDSEVDSISWARGINLASDWRSFRAAVSSCASPALGITYADVDGNIGYRLSGFIPLRRPGQGRVPSRGWVKGDEWAGFVALEDMPELYNPPSGMVVAANQPVVTGHPALLVEEPAGGFRARRIKEQLEAWGAVSPALSAELQADVQSLAAAEFRALVELAVKRHGQGRPEPAISLLRTWDGRLLPDAPGAALYELTLGHLFEALAGRRISEGLRRHLLGAGTTEVFTDGPYSGRMTPGLLLLLRRLLEDGHVPGIHADAGVLWTSMAAAWAELTATQGGNAANWRLGRLRRFRLEHPIAEAVAALRPVLSRGPFTAAGDPDTVRVGSVAHRDYRSGRLTAAFYRAVYDVGGESAWAAVPGQSGHPASANYADLIDGWVAARLEPFPQGDRGRQLRLEPTPG